jgi:hypothetical protein
MDYSIGKWFFLNDTIFLETSRSFEKFDQNLANIKFSNQQIVDILMIFHEKVSKISNQGTIWRP